MAGLGAPQPAGAAQPSSARAAPGAVLSRGLWPSGALPQPWGAVPEACPRAGAPVGQSHVWGAALSPGLSWEGLCAVFQKLGSLNSEPALPSTSYLPATPSVVPASSYIPSSETPPGEQAQGWTARRSAVLRPLTSTHLAGSFHLLCPSWGATGRSTSGSMGPLPVPELPGAVLKGTVD